MTIRVADYIADFIYNIDVDTVFTVTGGGAMFLNDGIAVHPHLKSVCCHHEQACAMAAVGYAKYKNSYSVCMTTTGCGSTNAITGLLDAWQDNVRCIFISGQVKKKETTNFTKLPIRQIGVQEADIISIVKSLTKYAVMLTKPEDVAYYLEKIAYYANSGRPGPVWLDVPMDIQSALVDESKLKHFIPNENSKSYKKTATVKEINTFNELLIKSERPVVIAGNGIRLANAIEGFRTFIEKTNIPFVTTYLGVDLLPSDHKLNIGRIGIKGDRAGNFTMQNADLIISLGSRLAVPSIGHEYSLFAREAKKIVIDIDPIEHQKDTIKIDCFINSDVSTFLTDVNHNINYESENSWIEKCRHWRGLWPISTIEYKNDDDGINLYYFMDVLSNKLESSCHVISDAGSSYYVTSQALKVKGGQRYITSGAQADMGFTLPAVIGVCVANNKKHAVGITGDGSFQMNIQELQTIIHHNLPIKIFVWNNNGYLSIRATQKKFFEGRKIGTDQESGVSFPDIKKIADAYGIRFFKVQKSNLLEDVIVDVLSHSGPVICEVVSPPNQEIIPTVSSVRKPDGMLVSKPLEDMYPFIDRKTFKKEMIVKPMNE